MLGEGVRKRERRFRSSRPVEDLGRSGENSVHHLANVSVRCLLLPVFGLFVWYWPRRLAQIRTLSAASHVLAGGEPRLVAMRAAFSLPYGQLLA